MAGERWTRVTRTRAGAVIGTALVFIGVGTYAATGSFDNPDTSNPVVRVSAIASPVDGTVTVDAVCKDNIGCTGVSFNIDGLTVYVRHGVGPYSFDWDTTTATDDTHALTATGFDAALNTATSSPRNVVVSNGRANEWVATTAGDTPTRCDPACAFNPDTAYGSFNAATTAASAGDLALVRDGTYTGQTISTSPSGTTPVTVQSANGLANVTVAGIGVSTDYVTVDGFSTTDNDPTGDAGYGITGISATDDSGDNPRTETHITYSNIDTHAAYITTDFVTFQHVVVGPEHACNAIEAGSGEDGILIAANPAQGNAHDITLDDVTVHDIDRWQDGVQAHGICTGSGSGEPHTDWMQTFNGIDITVENSHFYRNATSNILAKPEGGGVQEGWTLFNNEFGPTLEGGNGVLLGDHLQNCGGSAASLIENNTFGDNGLRYGCTGTPAVVRGNIFTVAALCTGGDANGTYTYNVFNSGSDGSCTGSSHAQSCTPTWADPAHADGNWDTASSDTCARDKADPTAGHFPALDIHGIARPIGAAPDAGANEAG